MTKSRYIVIHFHTVRTILILTISTILMALSIIRCRYKCVSVYLGSRIPRVGIRETRSCRVTRAQPTSDTHCERPGNKLQIRNSRAGSRILPGCETSECLVCDDNCTYFLRYDDLSKKSIVSMQNH